MLVNDQELCVMFDYDDAPHLRAYMLRLWEVRSRDPECPATWRFSLEDPHTGERYGFADLNGLIAFLKAELTSSKDK